MEIVMKKIFTIFLIFAVVLFGGCGSAGNGDNALGGVRTQTIADAILAEIEIPSSVKKEIEDIPSFFADLDTAGIEELSFYICGSGAFPDELLIIRFGTSEAAAAAKTTVENRLESRRADFRDYAPAEMYKLDSAGVLTSSGWLFFYVTEDNARVREIINSYL
ncbi:MAG: DUF4358 domain-containing protein [Oscillospiraceae bacterium]|nr:DUF4358 domain-containing protein [Oscillospiraceae bacterium]